jgi:hypothetical protein
VDIVSEAMPFAVWGDLLRLVGQADYINDVTSMLLAACLFMMIAGLPSQIKLAQPGVVIRGSN